MNLGLVIPCRNEALVIGRKLRNLCQLDWPAGMRVHRVVVVDDHSEDDTKAVAQATIESLKFPTSVEVVVISNHVQPGKPGAVRAGLVRLGSSVACCGVSDADVILDLSVPRNVLKAFAEDAELMMLSGEQVFVEALPENGNPGESMVVAADAYDRATAWWRRVESRFGALFSVHGQLLIWRAELGLEPGLELAADDLDLMLQVRGSHSRGRICLLSGSMFFECKTPSGRAGDAQALRRARAYVQVVRSHAMPPAQSMARKAQWLAYRYLPLAAPRLTLVCLFSILLTAALVWGGAGLTLAGAVLLFGAWTQPGRTWVHTMKVIRLAQRAESVGTLDGRWEMARN